MKPLINRLVSVNKLVLLDSAESSLDYSYWLVAPRKRASAKNLDALYRWVKAIIGSIQ